MEEEIMSINQEHSQHFTLDGFTQSIHQPSPIDSKPLSVLELSDKFGKKQDSISGWQSEVHDALTALGWSTKEANAAVQSVVEKQLPHKTVAEGLKSALELLNRIGRS